MHSACVGLCGEHRGRVGQSVRCMVGWGVSVVCSLVTAACWLLSARMAGTAQAPAGCKLVGLEGGVF